MTTSSAMITRNRFFALVYCLSIFAMSIANQLGKSVVQEKIAVADIALVIDQSGSIRDHYGEELNFAKKFISSFPIGTNRTRFALVQFSFANMTRVRLSFNEGSSKEKVLSTLDSMANDTLGAGTDFAKALQVVYDQVCKPEFGDRPDVPNVVVLVTDGFFNNPWERKRTVDAANKMRESGILLYAIQVKTDPDLPPGDEPVQDLTRLTGNRSRVFDVENFEKLTNELLARITQQITVEYDNCIFEYVPIGTCYRSKPSGRCLVDAELKIERFPQPFGQPCPTTNRTQIDCQHDCPKEPIENSIDPLPARAEKAIRSASDSENTKTLPSWAIILMAAIGGAILLITIMAVIIMRTPRWRAIFTPAKPGKPQLPGNMDDSSLSSSSTV